MSTAFPTILRKSDLKSKLDTINSLIISKAFGLIPNSVIFKQFFLYVAFPTVHVKSDQKLSAILINLGL